MSRSNAKIVMYISLGLSLALILLMLLSGRQVFGLLSLLPLIVYTVVAFRSLRCPKCKGHIYPAGAKHCPNCGEKLDG